MNQTQLETEMARASKVLDAQHASKTTLYCGDFRDIIDKNFPIFDTCFVDPPDNLGLKYDNYNDNLSDIDYQNFLETLIDTCIVHAKTTYISFYSKYCMLIGHLLWYRRKMVEIKWLIQGFTFGQHNNKDFGNNFRPIVRLRHFNAPLFPDKTRIESARMKRRDKRANKNGRVPGDVWFSDFLNYPRVVGNSKQRRIWSPTQLNEGVVEDCLLMSTPENGDVLDICSSTGTTIRVCKRNNFNSTSIEISEKYCNKIAEEFNFKKIDNTLWKCI